MIGDMKKIVFPMVALAAFAGAAADYAMKPGDDALALRDRIRADRKAGKIAADESVTVTLQPGDYRFAKTLVFEEKDSGTEKGPVTWRAAKPGTVRILGGSVIPRETFHPLSDVMRGRVDPSVADKVLEADGAVAATKRFLSPGFYKLPEAEPASLKFHFDAMDLPERGRYRLKVYPRNCFGACGRPIASRVLESKPGKATPWYKH